MNKITIATWLMYGLLYDASSDFFGEGRIIENLKKTLNLLLMNKVFIFFTFFTFQYHL